MMNNAIAGTIALLFVIMLATVLSAVWLGCLPIAVFGGIGAIITMLCLHDMYVIKARKKLRSKRIWEQVQARERDMKLTSDELFRSYTANEWR